MSRPGGGPAVPGRQARGHRGTPAGLPEKLMASVRPEFRADDLVFDPRDPVFGGPACVAGGCRLEVQYVLQCRGDERTARLDPRECQPFIAVLAAASASSLLEQPEEWRAARAAPKNGHGWRTFIRDARRRVEALAFGASWDTGYPRDAWRLRNLGIDQPEATISFADIPQPWLRELAKRYARWQLATGLSASTAGTGARAVTRFAVYLAAQPALAASLAAVNRPLLERYLAVLRAEMGGRVCHGQYAGGLNGFLQAIRRHGWDGALPASAAIFPGDIPDRGTPLPRALAGHVMAQVEQPANLGRQDNPAYRLITMILIRCGLRISSAARLPFECLVTDAGGAPYLRYWNTEMKREALVPIDDELHRQVGEQRQRVLERFPSGAPVLFPRPARNLGGRRPVSCRTYRCALNRWLENCGIRGEHGQPVHLTPHQWRHTLGTALINKDVPQHVVQKIPDHDPPLMTAHYARLPDKTARGHWERARKVDIAVIYSLN